MSYKEKLMCNKTSDFRNRSYKETNFKNGLVNKNNVECVNVGIRERFLVILKCVKIKVINPRDNKLNCEALALLDDGSTASYLSESLIKKLRLSSGKNQKLSIGLFNTPNTREIESKVVKVLIETKKKTKIEITANSVKYVTRPVPHILTKKENIHKSLKNKILNTLRGVPELLIGSDFYYNFELRVINTLPSGFKLINSRVGYLIAGKSNNPNKNAINTFNLITTLSSNLELESNIADYFSLESLGILEKPVVKCKVNKFENIAFNRYRFESNLLWRLFPPELLNNFGLSAGRLKSVIKNLKRNLDLLKRYDEIIKKQLKEGIIEKVKYVSLSEEPNIIHYLPHQPIYREDKDKLRIVYDASSKSSNKVNV